MTNRPPLAYLPTGAEPDRQPPAGVRWENLQRRIYLSALVVTALLLTALYGAQRLRGAMEWVDLVAFPAAGSLMLGMAVALWRRKVPLDLIRVAYYLVLTGLLVVKLWHALLFMEPDSGRAELLQYAHWVVITFVLGLLTFSPRVNLVASGIFWLLLVAPSLPRFIAAANGSTVYLFLPAVVQFHLANLVLLLLLAGIGSVREHLVGERVAAEFVAAQDFLTGTASRRHSLGMIAGELAALRADPRRLSIILFDLDHFKEVNDAYGHATGDAVLIEMARRVQRELQPPEVLGRWGGDEFVVVAPGMAESEGAALSQRLRHAVAGGVFPGGLRVTASFGVAEAGPGDTTETLLARVDAALYRAKTAGRDAVVADAQG